ncbi:acyl-[acyl-carrier-protein]--UDP-N-acetylglucosamine O-acyltransferase [Leptolyngbya sp. 'hensonii']|uniref:acyl-ACP--UDP-N-acetylglucosamine O-acyltransferase n=1 Tax=Leptolyngbya sp. 'hensonii' TaxID=1922337 RepID=UPI00094FF183|nr:acyl-ACP--UDP-N-acetylglucosamine O-acyltransferase [Leptolyngbya sp. 'hensonii']OLP19892.1 acyl-[acyl-carrier-protein]--UDP-N-acetylglucosamine O-acyltransferase [Leptolyngbya sp. 'hensonii']
MTIHPTAVIHPDAVLGEGVVVGAFSYIDRQVQLGDRCVISPHVTILPYTSLGMECQVHAGAVLGDLPQDMAYQEAESYVRIGNGCVIREGATIHRGTLAGSVTEVGHNCLLMAYSHLAHNVKLGNQVIVANNALLAGYVEVGDRAFISGNCLVHQFTRIGRLAMMAGGTAVQKDVPPFCITRSLSTNTVLNLNVIGLRRAGFTAEQRLILKRAFSLLYRSGLTVSQAVAAMEAEFAPDPLVMELCQFVKSSKRGICKSLGRSRYDSNDDDND